MNLSQFFSYKFTFKNFSKEHRKFFYIEFVPIFFLTYFSQNVPIYPSCRLCLGCCSQSWLHPRGTSFFHLPSLTTSQKNIGGKLITFSATLPTLGSGKLVNREDLKLLGTDKETQLLLPDVTFYKEFALDCSRQQITVDFFAFSSQYCDIATLGNSS